MRIQNGKIVTMAGPVFERGFVDVEGGRIARVGPMEALGSTPPPAGRVLDAEGGWVMPGLIESHCHMGISSEKVGLAGDDCNEVAEPVTPYLRALDGINPMDAAFHSAIAAGITSAMVGPGSSNIVGGQFVFLKNRGRCVDDMVVLQPAAMKVSFGENPKGNYAHQNRMPSSRMSIAYLLRKELSLAGQYMQAKRRARGRGEDFDAEMPYESWLPVLQKKIPLKAHVHRADDILTAVRIAKEFQLGLTLDHCTEGHLIAEEIKASGFPAIVGPSVASRRKPEIQYSDIKTAGLLAEAGVKLAITTDHPVSQIQYLPIFAGLAAREGLGLDRALRAITIDAAEICGVAGRLGSLEPGKDANIAVFTGNPLEVFTQTRYTLIDGAVVYRNDRLCGSEL